MVVSILKQCVGLDGRDTVSLVTCGCVWLGGADLAALNLDPKDDT